MRAEQNELVTRIGPGTPCGRLLRNYWQPVALLDEFDPALDPALALRPVKAVRLLGQDLVLFRDAAGRFGLLDRDCPHRGADLSFGRNEGDGLRCPFHGWKFDTAGRCMETPGEPPADVGRRLCERIQQRSYPVQEKSGVLFAWMGEPATTPPPFPAFDCFAAPASHTFAFKGLWHCEYRETCQPGLSPTDQLSLSLSLSQAPPQMVVDSKPSRSLPTNHHAHQPHSQHPATGLSMVHH